MGQARGEEGDEQEGEAYKYGISRRVREQHTVILAGTTALPGTQEFALHARRTVSLLRTTR
jgi:hypothetical protein